MSDWSSWEFKPLKLSLMKKDTGAGGQCQFTSISESLTPLWSYSASALRSVAAQGVLDRMTPVEFKVMKCTYQHEKSRENKFIGGWDPDQLQTKQDLASQILLANLPQNSTHFWGDDLTLSMISCQLNLDIYVFYHQAFVMRMLAPDRSTVKYAILLWYSPDSKHYQCIGIQHCINKAIHIQTIFLLSELPKLLTNYFNELEKEDEEKTRRNRLKNHSLILRK